MTAEALRERVQRHLDAYTAYRGDPTANRSTWSASLDDVCAWLWDNAMGPVLEKVGDADHATLVAGGLLGLLPLHAAWTADATTKTGRRYAIDALPLSYAPNARALSAARNVAASDWPGKLLALIEPRPVTGAALPGASLEGEVAAAVLTAAPVVLSGGSATPLNFKLAAQQADVLHLACHGYAELTTPLDSGLLLAGNRAVTLRDLLAMELRVRLAVLSACETSLPGTELPDEVVALPTGLLQAGVAGVVASLWAVPDRATAMLMAVFYWHWRCEQRTPAQALRAAQRWLRDTTTGEKRDEWAAAEWLPEGVRQAFIRALAFYDADARGHDEIQAWGAFAHVGA